MYLLECVRACVRARVCMYVLEEGWINTLMQKGQLKCDI